MNNNFSLAKALSADYSLEISLTYVNFANLNLETTLTSRLGAICL